MRFCATAGTDPGARIICDQQPIRRGGVWGAVGSVYNYFDSKAE